MIRFLSDWDYYPNAIPDFNTSNTHFVKYAYKLKKLGYKNWYFCLALLQPELQGYSPYDDNLSIEIKVKMAWELENNPWYFLRELLRNDDGGPELLDKVFKPHRGNIAIFWLMLCNLNAINIAPRQTGKSYVGDGFTLWLLYFRYKRKTINLFTKDSQLRSETISRLKKMRNNWPDWINPHTREDDDNQMTMSCRARGNRLATAVYQRDEKRANNLGRGLTSPFQLFDELPFGENVGVTLSAVAGSTTAAVAMAKRNNDPYGRLITTTAGNRETTSGKIVYELWSDAVPWTEAFFDTEDRDHLFTLITKQSKSTYAPVVNVTLNHRQLGYTDEWLLERIENAEGSPDNIERDYFNRWTSSSKGMLFPESIAKQLRSNEKTPCNINWVDKYLYMIREYTTMPSYPVILAVDTSNAIGRDDIANIAIDTRTGETIWAADINETNLHDYWTWLTQYLLDNPNIYLIIENKLNAQSGIDQIINGFRSHNIDPYTRMFNYVVQEQDTHRNDYKLLNQYGGLSDRCLHMRSKIGFMTNASRREFLFKDVLFPTVKKLGDKINDKKIIDQLLGLELRDNRVDHGKDGHDDMVIAYLIGHWWLRYGKNFTHYGINPLDVLSEVEVQDESTLTTEELIEAKRIKEAKAKITELKTALEVAPTNLEAMRIKAQIQLLFGKYNLTDSNLGMSLDALLQQADEKRDKQLIESNTVSAMERNLQMIYR